MKSELIENKGYNLSIHEYKGYKIFRGRSCNPFHIEKDGIIFYYKLKMSLNKIIKLIDENTRVLILKPYGQKYIDLVESVL